MGWRCFPATLARVLLKSDTKVGANFMINSPALHLVASDYSSSAILPSISWAHAKPHAFDIVGMGDSGRLLERRPGMGMMSRSCGQPRDRANSAVIKVNQILKKRGNLS